MASYKILQGEVTNGIFEMLRLECVARGYLPNFPDYATDDLYNAAKEAIRTSGKEIIEVYSLGSSVSHGEDKVNNIVLGRVLPKPSQSANGIGWDYDYNETSGKYDKSKIADTKYDVGYTITYMTSTEKYAEIIEDIIRSCFGIRAMIKSLNDDGEETGEFYVYFRGDADMSMPGYIERMVRYDAVNIDLQGSKSEGEFAPLTDLKVEGAFIAAETTLTEAEDTAGDVDTNSNFSIDIEIDNNPV